MKQAIVHVNVYKSRKLLLDPSIVLMFAFAVITVLLVSYLANSLFEFMRYIVIVNPVGGRTEVSKFNEGMQQSLHSHNILYPRERLTSVIEMLK